MLDGRLCVPKATEIPNGLPFACSRPMNRGILATLFLFAACGAPLPVTENSRVAPVATPTPYPSRRPGPSCRELLTGSSLTVPTLRDRDEHEQQVETMRSLAALGRGAICAKPRVVQVLRLDAEGWLALEAVKILKALGPQAIDTLPELAETLRFRRRKGFRSVVFSEELVEAIHSMGEGAIPFLVPYLHTSGPNPGDDPLDLSGWAGRALATFGRDALPALVQALDSPGLRTMALVELGNLRADAALAAPELLDLYEGRDKGDELRYLLGRAFDQMGSAVCGAPRDRLTAALRQETEPGNQRGDTSWANVKSTLAACPSR